jgi:hypothetical protein
MACTSIGLTFIYGGIGFIWRAVRGSTFPIQFYASNDSKCPNLESFFFSRRPGYTHSHNNSSLDIALSRFYLNSGWECESSVNGSCYCCPNLDSNPNCYADCVCFVNAKKSIADGKPKLACDQCRRDSEGAIGNY